MRINTHLYRTGLWLGLLAGAFHLVGYVLYAYGVWQGGIHTNIVSWTLWVTGTVIAYLVYREIANDWVKSFLNLVCVIGMFCIFGLVCYQLNLDPTPLRLDAGMTTDLAIAVLDVFVMFIWILFRKRSHGVIDFWFQLDIIISFIPIIRATVAEPTSETLLPWAFWTLAYLLQYFCVMFRPDTEEDGRINVEKAKRALNTPLNYLAWHMGMSFILLTGGAALF